MSDHHVPHFRNDVGVATIRVGAREFMCVGASPPFDHPHVYIDMGGDTEALCPYCSTRFAFDPGLHGGAEPPECLMPDAA